MEWVPNLFTKEIINRFVDGLLSRLPYLLGIDEFLPGCEVIDMDPDGVGTDTFPRLITVTINEYRQPVLYRGFPALTVGDYCTVVHYRQADTYEVLGSGGSSGFSQIALALLEGYNRGRIIRGGASNWEAYQANLYGYVLAGDGTDVLSVPVHGDALLHGDGELVVTGLRTIPIAGGSIANGQNLEYNSSSGQWEYVDNPRKNENATISGEWTHTADLHVGQAHIRVGEASNFAYLGLRTIRSLYDVADPPTAGELTNAFGSVADGFFAIVDDSGTGANLRLVVRSGGKWFYTDKLTEAV